MNTNTFKQDLTSVSFQSELEKLYGKKQIEAQIERYLTIFQRFQDRFPSATSFEIFSSSGRIEVGGNHTDHQLGRVLAMSVDLDTVAFACKNDQKRIHFVSKDYHIEAISCEDLSIHPEEYFTTMGLIRGLAHGFEEIHGKVGGFDAYVESSVMSGSGLSSSASVEVLIAKILDTYYGSHKMSVSDYAIIAQKAENNYFNKPCGLMDQMVIAHGGFCAIDFYDKTKPVVTKVDSHGMFESMDICLVQSGGSHADLSGDYAEIFNDCKDISHYFRQEVLSRVDEQRFNHELKVLYTQFDTRAILRAHHFFKENERVLDLMDDLKQGNLSSFLQHIIDSGQSSMNYLQNTWNKHSAKQGLALALMMAEDQLKGKGAYRVHGGGFAGTILLFVPKQDTQFIKKSYEAVFGKGCFIQIRLREVGVYQLK
jgi:galactokinase